MSNILQNLIIRRSWQKTNRSKSQTVRLDGEGREWIRAALKEFRKHGRNGKIECRVLLKHTFRYQPPLA